MTSSEIADSLEASLSEGIQEYLSRMAIPDAYYRTMLKERKVLGPVEREIGAIVTALFSKDTVLCEPGTGYGQLAIYLAALGYPVIAFESGGRFNGIPLVREFVAQAAKLAPIEFVNGWFPDAIGDRHYDVMVASNTVNSWWENNNKTLKDVLRGKAAIIDIKNWWRDRNLDDRVVFVREAEALGYTNQSICENVIYLERPKSCK